MAAAVRPINLPAFAEAAHARTTLFVADAQGVRKFAQAAPARAIDEVTPHIIEPAEQARAQPADVRARTGPDRRQRFGLAEAAFVCLLWCVIVGMDDDRVRAIEH